LKVIRSNQEKKSSSEVMEVEEEEEYSEQYKEWHSKAFLDKPIN
jgi:hypothetical protein